MATVFPHPTMSEDARGVLDAYGRSRIIQSIVNDNVQVA
jgi:hypothetical protein